MINSVTDGRKKTTTRTRKEIKVGIHGFSLVIFHLQCVNALWAKWLIALSKSFEEKRKLLLMR